MKSDVKLRGPVRVTDAIYQSVVQEWLAPFLVAGGFKQRRKDDFTRWDGDTFWRVRMFLRRVRGLDVGFINVLLSVGFRSLAEFLQGVAFPPLSRMNPKEPIVVAAPLPSLFAQPTRHQAAHEWQVLPVIPVEELALEIRGALEHEGLAFFGRFGTLEKALAAWEKRLSPRMTSENEDHCIAAAHWLRGDRTLALDFVRGRIADYRTRYNNPDRPPPPYKDAVPLMEQLLAFLERKMANLNPA